MRPLFLWAAASRPALSIIDLISHDLELLRAEKAWRLIICVGLRGRAKGSEQKRLLMLVLKLCLIHLTLSVLLEESTSPPALANQHGACAEPSRAELEPLSLFQMAELEMHILHLAHYRFSAVFCLELLDFFLELLQFVDELRLH